MKGHRRRIWKSVAFLGRYGHQPADVCLSMPVSDLMELAEEVGALMLEESEAMKTNA